MKFQNEKLANSKGKEMKKGTGYAVAVALSSVMLLATGAISGEGAENTPVDLSEEGWISNGSALGFPWWRKNPKKFEVLPEPLLYHFELNYAYSGESGNVDSEQHRGKGRLLLRKNTVTSDTIFIKDSKEKTKNIRPAASDTLVEKQVLIQEVRLAVLENTALTAGLVWVDKNTKKYIDQRMVYYGGILYTPVATPEFNLGIQAAYGYEDTSFMNGDIPPSYQLQPVDDYASGSTHLALKLRWNINEKITFSENAKYQHSLKNTDYYNWNATTKLQFKLSEHISFFTEYEFDFENNLFIESVQDAIALTRAKGKPTGTIDEMDTTISAGITVEF